MIRPEDLTQRQKDIFNAKVCPYCGGGVNKRNQSEIYARVYSGSSMHVCENYPKCNSYVGSHDEDDEPLGRLAGPELRKKKIEAHRHFDRLWKEGWLDRNQAYKELANDLKIHPDLCHVGYFSEATCDKVIFWSIMKHKEFTNAVQR